MASDRQLAAKRPELQSDDECAFMTEPNMLQYQDNDGVVKQIHLPKGTFQAAVGHFKAGNYEELAKYPVWSKYFPRKCLWL